MGLKLVALASFLAGITLVGYGVMQGDARIGFLLIIPFVYAQGVVPALGMLLVMMALILWMVASAREAMRAAPPGAYAAAPEWGETPRRSRSGGVVLLGPIPIVWGSDRRIARWTVLAGIVLLALAIGLSWARR